VTDQSESALQGGHTHAHKNTQRLPEGLSSVLEGPVNLLSALDSCGRDGARETLERG
jgi:hypothetical protein